MYERRLALVIDPNMPVGASVYPVAMGPTREPVGVGYLLASVWVPEQSFSEPSD